MVSRRVGASHWTKEGGDEFSLGDQVDVRLTSPFRHVEDAVEAEARSTGGYYAFSDLGTLDGEGMIMGGVRACPWKSARS